MNFSLFHFYLLIRWLLNPPCNTKIHYFGKQEM